jgi:uncharacterized protein (DUF2147 family)
MKMGVLALAAAALLTVAPAWADDLAGVWTLDKTPVELRFAPCEDAVCGLVETSARIQADPDARDIKNPTPALRSRRLKGLPMLDRLRPVGAAWKGRVYLPGSGATYDVEVRRVDLDHLKATGCMAPLLCQTFTLTRRL